MPLRDEKEGCLIKIQKRVDLSKCKNWRGTTLLSVPGKVFNRVLPNHMKDSVEDQVRDQQARFRNDQMCLDKNAKRQIIIEQSIEWKSSPCINFIDYAKTSGAVNRRTLWKLVPHNGIPGKVVNIIRNLYNLLHTKEVYGGHLKDAFQVRTGARQGCLLS